ncbi:hypothetical protein QFZ34_003221 [Phyllobacterium ifriqiyense]|uniref:Uncharacterized protein n=1 Tax=Phyllobacterium ifriqiyense TaxID=314238 RepID=A0ABU0SBB1_9HYPH|nr:hypothetical protein [Phyllobacterium ifriqiyense]MDQ0998039.1 hypothetical protein [Phyllobacterium ifriqiyense]
MGFYADGLDITAAGTNGVGVAGSQQCGCTLNFPDISESEASMTVSRLRSMQGLEPIEIAPEENDE